MSIRLNKAQLDQLYHGYLKGEVDDERIDYIELSTVDSFGNEHDDGFVRLVVDGPNYHSEDWISDIGTVTCIEFEDKTATAG